MGLVEQNLTGGLKCGTILFMAKGAEMETSETKQYVAIRMANGKTTHIRSMSSSTTFCGRWTANTRQYMTDEKEIDCSHCQRKIRFYPEAIAQGFSAKANA
jgi:hypothetical protein